MDNFLYGTIILIMSVIFYISLLGHRDKVRKTNNQKKLIIKLKSMLKITNTIVFWILFALYPLYAPIFMGIWLLLYTLLE